MSTGYSMPALGGMMVGHGISSFGLMSAGVFPDLAFVAVCLASTVCLNPTLDSELVSMPATSSEVCVNPTTSSELVPNASASSNLVDNPALTALIIGRCS